MSGFGNFINTLGSIGGALSPYAGIASAIGGLFSGSSNQKTQEAINERNIAFQQAENEKNRAFALSQLGWQSYYNQRAADIAWRRQLEMYERQYQDNSMKAMVQQAKEAGVNPFALFDSQGFQGASVTGIPQANGVSSALVNGVAPHAEMIEHGSVSGLRNFQAIASALSMLSQSDLNKAQKQSVMSMLQPSIDKLLAETENVELKNTYQSLINSYESYFGFSKREKELQQLDGEISNLLQETLLKGKEVDLKDWELRMTDIKEQILNNENSLGKSKVLQALKYLENIDEDYRTTFALRRAQAQQAKAGAAESNANAATINAIRPFNVGQAAQAFERGEVETVKATINTVSDAISAVNLIAMSPDLRKKLQQEIANMETDKAVKEVKAMLDAYNALPKGFEVNAGWFGKFGLGLK